MAGDLLTPTIPSSLSLLGMRESDVGMICPTDPELAAQCLNSTAEATLQLAVILVALTLVALYATLGVVGWLFIRTRLNKLQ